MSATAIPMNRKVTALSLNRLPSGAYPAGTKLAEDSAIDAANGLAPFISDGIAWPHSEPATFVITAAEEKRLREQPKRVHVLAAEDTLEALSPKLPSRNTHAVDPNALMAVRPTSEAQQPDPVAARLAEMDAAMQRIATKEAELDKRLASPAAPRNDNRQGQRP